METLERFIAEHPFLIGGKPHHTRLLTGSVANARFAKGTCIFGEEEQANDFYLICSSKVALEVFSPSTNQFWSRPLGKGIWGQSCLLPHARAMEETPAIAPDGKCR